MWEENEDSEDMVSRPQKMSGLTLLALILIRYRRRRNLTQEDLEGLSGVSARAISDIERGETTSPHKNTLERLAAALSLEESEREEFLAAVSPPERGPNLPAVQDEVPNATQVGAAQATQGISEDEPILSRIIQPQPRNDIADTPQDPSIGVVTVSEGTAVSEAEAKTGVHNDNTFNFTLLVALVALVIPAIVLGMILLPAGIASLWVPTPTPTPTFTSTATITSTPTPSLTGTPTATVTLTPTSAPTTVRSTSYLAVVGGQAGVKMYPTSTKNGWLFIRTEQPITVSFTIRNTAPSGTLTGIMLTLVASVRGPDACRYPRRRIIDLAGAVTTNPP